MLHYYIYISTSRLLYFYITTYLLYVFTYRIPHEQARRTRVFTSFVYMLKVVEYYCYNTLHVALPCSLFHLLSLLLFPSSQAAFATGANCTIPFGRLRYKHVRSRNLGKHVDVGHMA